MEAEHVSTKSSERLLRVGAVGCGPAFDKYLEFLRDSPLLTLVACTDVNLETARFKADPVKVSVVESVRSLLDSDVDVVLNLTPPEKHAEISRRGIACRQACLQRATAGRHRGRGQENTGCRLEHGKAARCVHQTSFWAGPSEQQGMPLTRGGLGRLRARPRWPSTWDRSTGAPMCGIRAITSRRGAAVDQSSTVGRITAAH